MKQNYANPLFRVPITFLEIFPVGLLIALISAAVLRNRKDAVQRTGGRLFQARANSSCTRQAYQSVGTP